MFEDISFQVICIVLGTLFVSTALHEMMHAYVALRLGDDLAHSRGRITLNPLKHIDPILTVALPLVLMLLGSAPILAAKPVPINVNRLKGREMGMALVGLAGPVTNLALGCVAALVLRNVALGGLMLDVVAYFFYINVGLFVFNMLPLPPLDGSRVLYAVAPEPVQRVMEQIESYGIMVIILFVSLFYSVIGPLIFSWQQAIARLLLG
jgi:Zn-dependent protease